MFIYSGASASLILHQKIRKVEGSAFPEQIFAHLFTERGELFVGETLCPRRETEMSPVSI